MFINLSYNKLMNAKITMGNHSVFHICTVKNRKYVHVHIHV